MKAQGFCQGTECIPYPNGSKIDLIDDESVNISKFWELMEKPVLHDEIKETWLLGAGYKNRSSKLNSLDAPDFTLPDINGAHHSISDYRGKRVFLTTWSSW